MARRPGALRCCFAPIRAKLGGLRAQLVLAKASWGQNDCTGFFLRLIAAMLIAEAIGTYPASILFGLLGQYLGGEISPIRGIIWAIAGDYFGGLVAFWFLWWILNPELYRGKRFCGWLVLMRDVLPLNGIAFAGLIFIYALEATIAVAFVYGIKVVNPVVGEVAPIVVYTQIANGVLGEMVMVGGSYPLLKWYAKVLAKRYSTKDPK